MMKLSYIFVFLTVSILNSSLFAEWFERAETMFPEEFQNSQKMLAEFQEKHGYPMDLEGYNKYSIENKLESQKRQVLWRSMKAAQNPIIDQDQLASLHKAKMQAITSAYSQHTHQIIGRDSSEYIQEVYAFDGEKMFSETLKGKDLENLQLASRVAFNGSAWKNLRIHGGHPSGEVSDFDQSRNIWHKDNVLKLSMLAEAPPNAMEHPMFSYLKQFENGAMIQEKLIELNGRECLLITDGVYYTYLDPSRGFAVVKLEVKHLVRDEDGYLLRRDKIAETNFYDFVDHGNNIYLPGKIERIRFYNDTKIITSVDTMEVNKAIDPELFENPFIDGTTVHDHVAGIVYTTGFPDYIEMSLNNKLERVLGIERPDFADKSIPNETHERDSVEKDDYPNHNSENALNDINGKEGQSQNHFAFISLSLILIVLMLIAIYAFGFRRYNGTANK